MSKSYVDFESNINCKKWVSSKLMQNVGCAGESCGVCWGQNIVDRTNTLYLPLDVEGLHTTKP